MGLIKPRYKVFWVFLWLIFYFVVIDIIINLIFPYPTDPLNIHPSFLQTYFEYGRSVEGKLDRMTRHSNAESAPIIYRAWLNDEAYLSLPTKSSGNNQCLIAAYGMSHMNALAIAINQINKNYIIRSINAPGAPPNWSFTEYQFDKDRHKADVVILGIMTDCVPFITSTSGATSYFDSAYPFTFPRYVLKDDKLYAIYPPFQTVQGYREYFYNPGKWGEYRNWLCKYDAYYDPILFQRSIVDKSSLIRMLRRAYCERIKRNRINKVYDEKGFNTESEEIKILYKIVKEFARSARETNTIPIIYIVNNLGRGDHLFKVLKPVLDSNHILYLSTHIICPPNNPKLFLTTNSHFIHSKDLELAQEMIKIIEKERTKK